MITFEFLHEYATGTERVLSCSFPFEINNSGSVQYKITSRFNGYRTFVDIKDTALEAKIQLSPEEEYTLWLRIWENTKGIPWFLTDEISDIKIIIPEFAYIDSDDRNAAIRTFLSKMFFKMRKRKDVSASRIIKTKPKGGKPNESGLPGRQA
jgi:hypothetical protein